MPKKMPPITSTVLDHFAQYAASEVKRNVKGTKKHSMADLTGRLNFSAMSRNDITVTGHVR